MAWDLNRAAHTVASVLVCLICTAPDFSRVSSSNLKFLQFFFFFPKVFLISSDIVFERQEVVIKLKRIYNEFSY